MNALRADLHSIKSVLDLDLTLTVADERVSSNVNINFTNTVDGDSLCTVRIATPEFVQGPVPPNTSLYVDVDVFTKEGFRSKITPMRSLGSTTRIRRKSNTSSVF